MLDIISMTSATNVCGWGGGGEREGEGRAGIGLYVETGQFKGEQSHYLLYTSIIHTHDKLPHNHITYQSIMLPSLREHWSREPDCLVHETTRAHVRCTHFEQPR